MLTKLNMFFYRTVNSGAKDGVGNLPGQVMIAVHIILSLVNWFNIDQACAMM